MNLPAVLALRQLKNTPKRTLWSLLSMILAVSVMVALGGFAANASDTITILWTSIYNENLGQTINTVILSLGWFFGVVTAFVSMIIISNSFSVSAAERVKQIGILKSVGAEKRQIISIVIYESAFLSIIALPIGLAIGLGMQFIITYTANSMIDLTAVENLSFGYSISPPAVISALVGSFITILISAWFPAVKSAKTPAIISIRGVSELNMKKKNSKNSSIIKKLLGFEGILAIKQMKHSKRRFRITVFSISVGIITILTITSLSANLLKAIDARLLQINNATINAVFISGAVPSSLNTSIANEINNDFAEIYNEEVWGFGITWYSRFPGPSTEAADILLVTVDPAVYAELAAQAGVPLGSNILVNVELEMDNYGNVIQHTNPEYAERFVGESLEVYETKAFVVSIGGFNGIDHEATNQMRHVTIHGELTSLPETLFMLMFPGATTIIVPELDLIQAYYWFTDTQDPEQFAVNSSLIFDRHINLAEEEVIINSIISNELMTSLMIIDLLAIFLHTFTILLILLGLANIVSTVTTAIKLRKKEFAALISVGMTKDGIMRMLLQEGLMSSARALLFGLPLGFGAAWLVYLASSQLFPISFSFSVPWAALSLCSVGVFIIIFATTRIAASGVFKSNIIETIRGIE